MTARVIDVDPISGLKTLFDWDSGTESFRVGYEQDTSVVLDDNKGAMLDLDTHRKEAKEEWAHYAKIPTIVEYEWLYKYGVDVGNRNHWKKCMSLLNSPDYKYLKRTSYFHDR